MIDIAYEIEAGFKSYIWEGGLYDQPLWFIQLLRIAQSEIRKVRREIAEAKKKAKK